jgi:hypothetical protein
MSKIPTYDITIDPAFAENGQELGINMIALTSNPAIMVKGVAYANHKKQAYSDNIKMRITAPVMIPMDIYRKDEDGTEYNTRFTEKTIEEIYVKMMSDLKTKDLFNNEHNKENKVNAFILEAWIVEDEHDKAYSKYKLDVPKGTLMATLQFRDEKEYKEAVDNGRVGLSIEGFLGMKQLKYNIMFTEEQVTEINKIVDSKIDEVLKIIADMKGEQTMSEDEKKEDEKKEEEYVKMSAHERLRKFMDFNNKKD